MIENISYEDLTTYAKELAASSEVIKDLIKDQDFSELEGFTEAVDKYSTYLTNQVELYKQADETLEYLTKKKELSKI